MAKQDQMKRILRAEKICMENNEKNIESMRTKLSNEHKVEIDLLKYQYSQKIKGQKLKVEAEVLKMAQKKDIAENEDA